MNRLKFINPFLKDIYTKKYINYKGERLKSILLINLIDIFLSRYIYFKKDNIKLNSRILKKIYGSSYSLYLNYLLDNEFIYLYKNYSVGFKAKCYKLTNKTKADGYLTVMVEHSQKLEDKLLLFHISNNRLPEFMKQKLIKDLFKINIDINGCKNWIDENIDKNDEAYQINLSSCNKINIQDIYYSFDNYGRFHTNFTVLKKELRSEYLTFGTDKIKEIDITNSQPFFLYLLMRKNGFTEFDGFDKDVMSGRIYDRMMEISGEKRKHVKTNVYSVLFGRNMSKNYWNELFNELYPAVYDWISTYKKINNNYKIIAHELQRIESDFIFTSLIPSILETFKDLPMITIHDSIIIPEYAYMEVKTIFLKCLSNLIFRNTDEDQ